MPQIENWSKVHESREKYDDYQQELGVYAEALVWEYDDGDIDFVVYKTRNGKWNSSLDGDDFTDIQNDIGEIKPFDDINSKEEAHKKAVSILQDSPNPLGVLAEEKFEVFRVSVGQYSSQGMGAVSYASDEAERKAEIIEDEFDVDTAIGSVQDRTTRSFAEGGNYGGYIPVYADRDLDQDEVERVVREVRQNEIDEDF